ncbi:XRE family transcriptional regulator [Streptomyces sp. NPDC096205]|uniref:XRE family transcriptional regulator n=1 Tax=Streptomyces sp. NPDC096205 TaxID=3366081 RepID=UPI0037F2A70C
MQARSRFEQHPLAYVRRQLGWSMERLAHELQAAAARHGMILNPGRDRIYKWESGRVTAPDDDYQMLLAEVFRVGQTHVAQLGWPWWLPAFDTPHDFSPRGTRAALREVLVALHHPDRRTFLAISSGALAGAAQQWATVEPERLAGALNGRRVDPTLVTWLETRTDELRAMTNTSAPECTDLVHSLLRTAIQLIDNAVYDHATERRLHQVAASAAQCAAWLHFDQGEHAAAQKHWLAARHASHAAADRDLGAGILSDLAYLATWLNLPATAIPLLETAQSHTRSPAARALLQLRRAGALAASGDTHATHRALLAAEKDLNRARPATTPAWASWMSPADLEVDSGRCWLALGQPRRAEQALTHGVALLSPSRERTRSLALAYRAETALARRDLETAAHDARTALDTALATDASRCIRLVQQSVQRITRHRTTHPAVQTLHEYALSRTAD